MTRSALLLALLFALAAPARAEVIGWSISANVAEPVAFVIADECGAKRTLNPATMEHVDHHAELGEALTFRASEVLRPGCRWWVEVVTATAVVPQENQDRLGVCAWDANHDGKVQGGQDFGAALFSGDLFGAGFGRFLDAYGKRCI